MDDAGSREAGASGREDPKKKSTAITLAFFLGPFAWLYTYEKDKWKLFAGLATTAATAVVLFVLFFSILEFFDRLYDGLSGPDIGSGAEIGDLERKFLLGLPLLLLQPAFWIWAIVDALRRPAAWYENYPD